MAMHLPGNNSKEISSTKTFFATSMQSLFTAKRGDSMDANLTSFWKMNRRILNNYFPLFVNNAKKNKRAHATYS
jgi:hypothetical protein